MSNDTPKMSFVIIVKITDRRLKVVVEAFFLHAFLGCLLYYEVFCTALVDENYM